MNILQRIAYFWAIIVGLLVLGYLALLIGIEFVAWRTYVGD